MKNVTDKQLSANRENAKKGGVTSEEGKEVSKKNAMKHGVLSLMKTQYEELRFGKLYHDLEIEYKVETSSQRMLLEQLVSCYIKLARCAKFETKISLQKKDGDFDFLDPEEQEIEDNDPTVERKFVFDQKAFAILEPVLLRYEPMLIRRMTALMRELREIRDR